MIAGIAVGVLVILSTISLCLVQKRTKSQNMQRNTIDHKGNE